MWPLVMQKVKDRRALASKYIRDPAYQKQVRPRFYMDVAKVAHPTTCPCTCHLGVLLAYAASQLPVPSAACLAAKVCFFCQGAPEVLGKCHW